MFPNKKIEEILNAAKPSWQLEGGLSANPVILSNNKANLDFSNKGGKTYSEIFPDATTVVAKPPPFISSDTSSSDSFPFQGLNASTSGSTQVRVVYGTIQSVVPDGMSSGDDPPFVLPISGSGFVVAECTVDLTALVITDISISVMTSLPDNTQTTFYITLFSFSVDTSTSTPTVSIAQSVGGSLGYMFCGDASDSSTDFQHIYYGV